MSTVAAIARRAARAGGSRLLRALGWAWPCVALGQQPIPAPVLKPFADNRQWVLVDELRYSVGDTGIKVVVPKGFVTDFASIPQAFWSFGLSPNGRYSRAAIVHDYLYWAQVCSRLQSDNLLLIAMKESTVPAGQQGLIYDGVRVGGTSAWNANAAARANGLPRVIPAAFLDFGPLDLWSDYQARLAGSGVSDPAFPQNPDYCALGDAVDVPAAPASAAGNASAPS